MNFESKSIGDQIDSLATITGAPESFVDQVRELFTRKGISLEDDCAPYLRALEEAFIREESIRAGASTARQAFIDPAPAVDARGLGRARRGRSARRARRVEPSYAVAQRTLRDGAGPMLVTRQQHEEMPLVPGPDELQ